MQTHPEPWRPWEYRVLHEGHDPEETGRLLGRRVEDVSRKLDRSFAEWYRRRRCPGSPKDPHSLVEIARRIYREDRYWKWLTEGELEALILDVAKACLKNFDPDKMHTEVVTTLGRRRSLPVQEKFVRYFVICLRRRLDKTSERIDRRRRKASRTFEDIPDDDGREGGLVAPDRRGEPEGRAWSRFLFRKALARLKPQCRRFVEYRYLEGLDVPEIAARMGLKPQTLYNTYSKAKIASLIQKEVRNMMLNIPVERLQSVVHHLHFAADFNEKSIADLLCIPREVVVRHLDGAIDRIMSNMAKDRGREEVMGLIDA